MKIDAAIELLLQLAGAAGKLSALLTAARAAGRTELTDEELNSLADEDNAAMSALAAEIARAQAAGK